ncbi:hypothetical protein EJ08DRAFT_691471 [Tothia fuscella]|uniref:FAR1 domain-containing protein n=1 Tax=Tothia fuscella TaxID=1048955 RepID=A0A9P4P2N1_9PEZI|nr:hypothetical protein EJ08DRAFT_691471 [Tothia fuscella]
MAAYSSTPARGTQQMLYPPFPGAGESSSQTSNGASFDNQAHSHSGQQQHPLASFPPHAPFSSPYPPHHGQLPSSQNGSHSNLPPRGGSLLQFVASNGNAPGLGSTPGLRRDHDRMGSPSGSEGGVDLDAGAGANNGDEDDVEEEQEDDTPPEGFYFLPPPPPLTYDTPEEAVQAVHDWNKDHGFDVSKQKPMKNKAGELYKYLYRCTRHGRLDNNRKLTDETRKRKRKSGKTGCPMGLYVKAIEPSNPAGRWKISYQQNRRSKFHNHEATSAAELTGHRRRHRTEEMKALIRQQRQAGMDATQTLAYIKERMPDALVTRQDILNYRRADPGPLSDNTNYLDKPYILCISFLQDFENDSAYGQALLQKLRTKLPVSVCTKPEHYTRHFEKNPPKVVLIADPALSYPAYRLQLARLVTYNQDGGTVIFMGHFTDTPREFANAMFLHHYNLEWEVNGEVTANPNQYRLNDKLEAGGSGGRYTVVARNFAPGTDVGGIESLLALSPHPSLISCRLYSQQPIVVAEIVFATQEGAEAVIDTFSGKSINLGRVSTAEGKELSFALRAPAPMSTSDLAPSCFVRANFLTKVEIESVVYEYVYSSDVYGQWGPPMVGQGVGAACAAYAKVGRGFMGYVGLVEYDENYLKTVAAMCHF